ncbi:hypothetical protein ACTFIR_002956 [Dictyostelium discoideum]
MEKGLLTWLVSKKCSFTILVDSSGSINEPTFNLVKICVSSLVCKLPQSFIQIINFSNNAHVVSEFKKDKKIIEEEIQKNLKRLGEDTNFILGLELAHEKIKELPDDSNHVIIFITDGHPSDNPSTIIKDIIIKKIEFFGIGVGSVSKSGFEILFPGQHILIYKSYSDLCDSIEKITPSNVEIPFEYRIKPSENKIQKSSDPLLIDFIIIPSSNKKSFEANEISIKILANDYYLGYEVLVDKQVDFQNPFTARLILNLKNNSTTKSLPESIFFEVNIKKEPYIGYFHLDLSWFCADLKYPENINIIFEGVMGNGKTSMINLIYNLFTSNSTIDNHFLTARQSSHVTTKIEFSPISALLNSKHRDENFLPIYQEIIDNLNLVLVDKPGMTATDAQLSCVLASLGCYSPETSMDYVPLDKKNNIYECHSFIFVISLGTFLGQNPEKEMVKQKITECLSKAKIQPILAITFCDNFSRDQMEVLKESIFELPVEKENVFFITPYIDNETNRIPSKDHLGWKLIKRAFEIGKNTIEQKKTKKSCLNYYSKLEFDKQQKQQKQQEQFTFNITPLKNVLENNGSFSKTMSSSLIECDNNSNSSKELEFPILSPNSKSIKPWILLVSRGTNTLKFKVSPFITISEFIQQISQTFGIDTAYFNLKDSDGCILSGVSILNDILEDLSSLIITDTF